MCLGTLPREEVVWSTDSGNQKRCAPESEAEPIHCVETRTRLREIPLKQTQPERPEKISRNMRIFLYILTHRKTGASPGASTPLVTQKDWRRRNEACLRGLSVMNSSHISKLLLIGLVAALAGPISSRAASQPVRAGFLYALADFTGPIRASFSRVVTDRGNNEVYVLYQNIVRVFNDSGMEIYRFGDDLDVGQILDVAVDRNGDILLLIFGGSRSALVRCNFRGEPKSVIEFKRFPPEFSGFNPNRMIYWQDAFYLISALGMKLVVADGEGFFKKGYDLIPLFELDEKDRGNVEIGGFSVDDGGNVLTTIPVLFRVFILSPDGAVTWFGKPGGGPGRFNIAAGVVRDSKGNYVVVDRLKCAVLVFDKNFNFRTQFGRRGYKPGELISPDEIAIDNHDRIYVTHAGKRAGVSVYALNYN